MNQTEIEYLIHPKHITNDIRESLIKDFSKYISKAVKGLRKWLEVSEWESKNRRKEYVSYLDLHSLVADIITATAMNCQQELPYISLASMVSIDGMDKYNSIKTVSEILAVLEPVGFYEIIKYPSGTRMIQSLIDLDQDLLNRLNLYCYLPPMIERPNKLYHNKSSEYKTINKDSLILGFKENHHDKSISLDILNTLNNQEYEIDTTFISNYERQFHRKELSPDEMLEEYELSDFDSYDEFIEQYNQELANFELFKEQFKALLTHVQDKTIYFTHKVDKRGRVYSQGYHFNYQGDSYSKACINLKKKELCTGEL
ncbi:hypothetical protein ACF3N0_00155 [Moraxella atlantae]|uniref:hypothetical protein n=1 Tax=Faucicola atlantae TaxID=34059 RepID=UPI003753ABA5